MLENVVGNVIENLAGNVVVSLAGDLTRNVAGSVAGSVIVTVTVNAVVNVGLSIGETESGDGRDPSLSTYRPSLILVAAWEVLIGSTRRINSTWSGHLGLGW